MGGGGLGLMKEIPFRNDLDGFLTLKQFSVGQNAKINPANEILDNLCSVKWSFKE